MVFFLNAIWLGSFGAFIAWYVNLPAPFIIGPTVICTVAAIMGVKFVIPKVISNTSFIIIGLTLGSNVTPNSLAEATKWPISLCCMLISVLIITFLGQYLLKLIFSIDRKSSILASAPGHLSFVLSISSDIRADTTKISVIQSTRVLTLTLITPLIIVTFSNGSTGNPLNNTGSVMQLFELVLLLIFSIVGGFFIKKTKIPAAYLISGMIFSTLGNGTAITSGQVPEFLTTIAFITLGTLVGSRFLSVSLSLLRDSFFSGLLLTLLGIFSSLIFAGITYKLTGFNFLDIIIAFAPGGLETMVAMGTLVNADPTYVATHHVMRLFLLSFLVPYLIYK